jgi:hypothetical protein
LTILAGKGENMIRWKALIRDVIVIYALTSLAGFILGFAAGTNEVPMDAVGLANILFSAVGFTISACAAKQNRFRHLVHVGIAVWLFSAFNMLYTRMNVVHWVFTIIPATIALLAGWGLSYLFVGNLKIEENTEQ